jgi:hypothetical protein
MELWQIDIVDGGKLVDGSETKIVTGVDDHSRFCVITAVVPRATGWAVYLALMDALRRFGIPQEILTDNGKQFTARFGTGGETLFDRICQENGIAQCRLAFELGRQCCVIRPTPRRLRRDDYRRRERSEPPVDA